MRGRVSDTDETALHTGVHVLGCRTVRHVLSSSHRSHHRPRARAVPHDRVRRAQRSRPCQFRDRRARPEHREDDGLRAQPAHRCGDVRPATSTLGRVSRYARVDRRPRARPRSARTVPCRDRQRFRESRGRAGISRGTLSDRPDAEVARAPRRHPRQPRHPWRRRIAFVDTSGPARDRLDPPVSTPTTSSATPRSTPSAPITTTS
jgi:hypothetical protein